MHGACLTLGIELMLAGDMAVITESATFAQLEVARGVYPFGPATLRFPRVAGWGNAMRWMLTGDRFDAAEADLVPTVRRLFETEDAGRAVQAFPLPRHRRVRRPLTGADGPRPAPRVIAWPPIRTPLPRCPARRC